MATNGTLAFAEGQTEQTVAVRILNDGTRESAESFQVNLSNPGGWAVLGTVKSTTVTIEDNDPGFEVEFGNYYVQEDAGPVVIAVLRGSDEDLPATVDFATINGSAVAGQDYVGTNGTLSFGPGEALKLVGIPILNDAERENQETFTFSLRNPGGGAVLGTTNTATVRIADNDPGFEVEFANYYVEEDAGPVVIAVLRGNDGDFPATVDFATSNGAAVAGQDYVGTNGTLSFGPGEPLKLVGIPILNDAERENQETFTFSLRNPGGGAVLGTRVTATVSLYESDPGVRFERTQHWVHEHEGELRVTVLRGNDRRLGPFTVEFATSNFSAIAGQDYLATNGTLAFAEGEMQQTFAVRILNDAGLEADEQFRVLLTNVTGDATLSYPSNTTATVTVCDATGMKPHGFKSLQVSNDGTVRLTLEGGVSKRFEPFFDLYPLEVSSNLVDWAPLAPLVRTNTSTNALVFRDAEAQQLSQRFYRLANTNLITPSMAPTGPYGIGRVDRFVTDPSRRNRYNLSTNGSFMISIWYPGTPSIDMLPMPYVEEAIAHDPNPDYVWGGLADRIPYFTSYSKSNVAIAADMPNYPVILYSHGGQGFRSDNQDKVENLASHGYVIVACDHVDSYTTFSPDGTYLTGKANGEATEWSVEDRVKDLVFLVNLLEQ